MQNPNIDLRAFILQNHSFMTVSDIVEETGSYAVAILKVFDELGLKPISAKDQTKQLILTYKDRMPLEAFCKKFNVGAANIKNIARELGVNFMLPPPEEKTAIASDTIKRSTIAERLATVRRITTDEEIAAFFKYRMRIWEKTKED